jgi:acetylornithine deacetylase/succinyl-diaminopimelate desuccinylase-like protein
LTALGRTGSVLYPLFHNTATATVVRGGCATNVVPTELSVDIDGRVLPGMSPDTLLSELTALAPEVEAFDLVHVEPAAPADANLELLPRLAEVLRAQDPALLPIPWMLAGYTDARYLSKLGIQTYGFLPMRLPPEITIALMHAPDERVPADSLQFGIDCLVALIERYGDKLPEQRPTSPH